MKIYAPIKIKNLFLSSSVNVHRAERKGDLNAKYVSCASVDRFTSTTVCCCFGRAT